jgi:SOS-response transcriptional repressor LexA
MAAVLTTQEGLYSLLEVHLPGGGIEIAGVLLLDSVNDQLHLRLRRDWDDIAKPDDAEVLEALSADLSSKAVEMGATHLFEWLEANLSNTLRVTDRKSAMVEDFDRALNRLYSRNVISSVKPLRTHLPVYTLRAAAGKFLDNDEISDQGWEEAPEDLRITPEMFVARIAGRSMEPKIPDGSLCVFRQGVTGSRQGRLVLVEWLGGGTNDRYTVKRYTSVKTVGESGWKQERIRLEPLNPEFEAWDLDPEDSDRLHVIAEFVRVLY